MTFIPPRDAEADFVTASSARFRQLAQYQESTAARGAAIIRSAKIAQHYRKYPWTNPGLATAFSKWKEDLGAPAARGLSRAVYQGVQEGQSSKDAIEAYTMTNEFKRRLAQTQAQRYVQDFKDQGNFSGLASGVGDILDYSPLGGAKALIEGKPLSDVVIRSIPGAKIATDIAGTAAKAGSALPVVGPGIQAGIRTGLTALETPYQEIQGQAMQALTGLIGPIGDQAQPAKPGSAASRLGAVAGAPDVQPLSSGGIAVERLLNDKPVDLGEGFLPAGNIEEERDKRLREIASLTYDGKAHFLTPGRTFAYMANNAFGIAEPGSVPYNVLSGGVDAAAIITTDPANIALLHAGEIGRARKGFDLEYEAAGGFADSWRAFTHGPTVQRWGDSADGSKFFRWVAQLDPEKDFLHFQKATGWKIPIKDSVTLMEQETPEAVRAVFDPLAGVAVRNQPSPWSFGSVVRQTAGTRRIFNTRSTDEIVLSQLDGPGGGLNQFYNWMVNRKIPESEISPILHDLATSRSGYGAYTSLKAGAEAGEAAMRARGVPADVARDLSQVFHNDLAEGSRYYAAQITDGAAVPGVVIDGTLLPETSPHLWVEAMNDTIHLPSSSEFDKAMAKYGRVLGIPGSGVAEDSGAIKTALQKSKYAAWSSDAFLTHVQSAVWVPLQLLRGAWTLRVIGEEQIRMAATGLSNVFSHPIQHIGWVGSTRDIALTDEALSTAMRERGALTNDTKSLLGEIGAGNVVAKGKAVYNPGHARYERSWADELLKLNADPVANNVAKTIHEGGDLQAVKDAFWGTTRVVETAEGKVFEGSKNLTKFRKDLMENERLGAIIESRSGSDAYIDSVAQRIHDSTNGHGDLVGVIANGKLGEEAVTDGLRVNPNLVADLRGREGPNRVVGDVVAIEADQKSVLDKGVRFMFSNLMAKPSNYLSRSPTFKQKYWERVAELMAVADTETQQLAVKVAREAKLPKSMIADLQARVGNKVGELSYAEVDDLSKGFALDEVRDLLYDLNRRSQFFDATRLLFPFGEAWKEVLTRWATIPFEHPEVIRRAQIGITELKSSNPFNNLPGAVPDAFKDQGFFYKDPSTGQESFAYPWSQHITDAIIGHEIPFTSQASGLSIAFNLIPGIGVVSSFAANAFMSRFMADPKYDTIRQQIFPYGEPDYGGGILESFLPSWVQKFVTSQGITKEDSRMLNNTVNQILSAGAADGTYDMNSRQGIQEAVKDAEGKARTLYMVRGTFQWGAPAAPSPRFLIETKKGAVLNTTLRDEYFKLTQKNQDTATAKFLERFGEEAFYSTQAFTISGSYALPFTKKQLDWTRTHPDEVSKYPSVYGFFTPPGDTKDFDYDAYLRSIATGERESLSPKDWVKHANDNLGWMWYDRAKAKMGLKKGDSGTRQQQLFLADLRDKIRESYPGWQDVESSPNKLAHGVQELQEASQDSALKKSNRGLTDALDLYFIARDEAVKTVKARGGTSEFTNPGWRTSDKYADVRDYLRRVGDAIAEEYPRFANAYETVLQRDIGDE